MTHEIDADFYCGQYETPKDCPDCGDCARIKCEAYHRKWPTPAREIVFEIKAWGVEE